MIYFRGCVVREKLTNIESNTVKILNKANVHYRILENEECCGSFLLRTGFREDSLEVMKNTLQNLKGNKVLVSCAGCYNTLKNNYKQLFGVDLDVIHTSQFFRDLIGEGILKPKKIALKVTYHDPCHLGRHCGEYKAPRDVLNCTAHLVKMDFEKDKSRCCGAGGGVKSAFPKTANKLAQKRVQDASDVDADILASSCSFCIHNLTFATKNSRKDPNELPVVMDISEVLLRSLSNERIHE